jgi:hypothetical protein
MATITAKATGNWSAGSTWDSDPALPAAGDTVNCAGYTVTIDQDVAVVQLKSTAAGYFAVTAARNITANILSDTGHSGGGVVRCSHATGTVTITGSVTAGPSRGADLSGAGTLNITGNVTGGSAASAIGVANLSSGTFNITGDVQGGSTTNCQGALNNSTGTMTITGNVIGGVGTLAHGALANAGTMTITGNATGGSGSTACGAYSAAATSVVNVQGICYGGSILSGFGLYGVNAAGKATFSRAVFSGAIGAPVGGYVQIAVAATTNYCEIPRSDTGVAYKLSNDYPTEAQVESGVTYKLGTQTGTLVGGAVSISPIRGNVG